MRSVLVVSGGEKGQRCRVGPMKWLLCLGSHRVEDPVDVNFGVWLQSFQLLDTEQSDQVCPSFLRGLEYVGLTIIAITTH